MTKLLYIKGMRYTCLLFLLVFLSASSFELKAQYAEQTFDNTDNMQVQDNGPASTYPSITTVSGLPTNLAYIRVTFNQLNHPWSTSQFDILLEAPNGERIVLLSDADPELSGDNLAVLHIDADANTYVIPGEFHVLHPFSLPTNIGAVDIYPVIDTIDQANPTFDNLQNINPNGDWKLYVRDDSADFGGASLGSWSLTIGANTMAVCNRPVGLPLLDYVNRNTAVVNWSDDTATNWDVLYSTSDTVPDYSTLPTVENITGQSITIQDLDYDTEYAFYLRADCDGDNMNASRWNGPLYFTTESGVCAYAKDIELCSIEQFNPNVYQGGFYDPCNNGGGFNAPQLMFNFSPPSTGDYYFFNASNNNAINSFSIKTQSITEYCDSTGWNCLAEDFTGDVLMENLQQDSVYKLLIHNYNYFNFQISECPEFAAITLEDFTSHSFDVDFYLTAEDLPLAGDVEIFYEPANGAGPNNNTVPIASGSITDGLISTVPLSLVEDSDYELYVRQLCTNGKSCWQGPFDFSTSRHCGDIGDQNSLVINTTTATTAWIQTNDSLLNTKLAYIVMRDSFFEQPDYADNTMQYPIASNFGSIFVYDLEPNTSYTFYLKLYCGGFDFPSQYWQGPYTLQTNGDCFVEVENLFCDQCYVNEINSRDDENIPFYHVGMNDLFPGDNPENCTELDYTPRLERIYRYDALEDGTLTFQRGQKKSCSNSKFLAQYYYKSASLPCDLTDWNYLGCWTHEGNDIFDDIVFEVEKDSSYYIMFDYAGNLCAGGNSGPNTWLVVKGDNCQNPCPEVDNLSATDNGDGYFTIEWDEVPSAIGYDIVSGAAHDILENIYKCKTESIGINNYALYPNTSLLYNVDSLVALNGPNVPLSLYVRSRCAIDNYGPWTEVSITPDVGSRSYYHNGNTLNSCSPTYNRTTLSPANDVPYDIIEFTVDKTGTYYFEAASWASEGTYAGVYENSFEPNSPSQNLIFEVENTALAFLKFSTELTAGVPYVFIANHRVPSPNPGLYILEVDGPSKFSADKFKYRGTHEGPQGIIPSTSGQFYQSNKMCRDDEGWRHYYYSDATNPNAQDLILLSIEDYDKLANINQNHIAFAGGDFGTSLITNPPADYVSLPNGWRTMNRHWNIDMAANLQPNAPVGIRFYYTEADLIALRNATGNTNLAHEDLNFYKINDPNDEFDIDPTNGHSGIPLAAQCDELGIWEYFNSPVADTVLWRLGTTNGGLYAEMKVHSFSGGGGGIGSFAIQTDSDMDGYLDAVDCAPNNASINPGAMEIPYDGLDNDCNPLTLDDDLDMDGFDLAEDCDDQNVNINPNVDEVAYDGVDNDCDPMTLDDDLDMDGYVLAEDCDDDLAEINPGADEVPYDGMDNDCDPLTLDDDLDMDGFVLAEDCDDDLAEINPGADEVPYDGMDNDCDPLTLDDDLDMDGFVLAEDCDDGNAEINPAAQEIPNNGIDEDCLDGDLITSIEDFPNHLLAIFPNPTTHFLFIEEKGLNNASVLFYDVMGNILLEKKWRGNLSIDMSEISNGVYFLKVKALEGEVIKKVVKI